MKLLMLGGTVFLGRHLVDAALARGHAVTLFNRGQHNPELYPEVEKLCGDRDGNLTSLEGRRWDAVIDTCGYVPRIVGDSARLLADLPNDQEFVNELELIGQQVAYGQSTVDKAAESLNEFIFPPIPAI